MKSNSFVIFPGKLQTRGWHPSKETPGRCSFSGVCWKVWFFPYFLVALQCALLSAHQMNMKFPKHLDDDYLGIMFNLCQNPSKWLKICLHNSCQRQRNEEQQQTPKKNGVQRLVYIFRLSKSLHCCSSHLMRPGKRGPKICHFRLMLSFIGALSLIQIMCTVLLPFGFRLLLFSSCVFIYHLIRHWRTFGTAKPSMLAQRKTQPNLF